MIFFDNIYASSYRFYAKFKEESPWSTSIILVTVCQIELFFLVLTLIKKFIGINPFLILPNKFYFLPIFFLWLFFMYRYYTKEKAANLVDEFGKKRPISKKYMGCFNFSLFFTSSLFDIDFVEKVNVFKVTIYELGLN